jgi:hypothetical protein
LPNAKPMSREQIDNKSVPSKPVGSSRKLRSFATSYDWVWKCLELSSLECSMYQSMKCIQMHHGPRNTAGFLKFFPRSLAQILPVSLARAKDRAEIATVDLRSSPGNPPKIILQHIYIFTSSPLNVTYVQQTTSNDYEPTETRLLVCGFAFGYPLHTRPPFAQLSSII